MQGGAQLPHVKLEPFESRRLVVWRRFLEDSGCGVSYRSIIIAIIAGSLIIAAGLAIGLALGIKQEENVYIVEDPPGAPPPGPYSQHRSATGQYAYAGVVSDDKICSTIGTNVLAALGGNAVDAAVATLLCVGVMTSHSAGIGGGAFWTIRINGSFYSMNARERAPLAAHRDMYNGYPREMRVSQDGGLSIAVPGEVMGMYEAHKRFGLIAWAELVNPTVRLCEEGHPLSVSTAIAVLEKFEDGSINRTSVPEYFDADSNPLTAGATIRLPRLAATMRAIASDPMSFYTGRLAQDIVADIVERDGIINATDLSSYHVTWDTPTVTSLPDDVTLYSTPPPGSGVVLGYILGILAGYNMSPSDVDGVAGQTLTLHRAMEAFKFAFAKRSGLGDADFVDNGNLPHNMTSQEYCEQTRHKITDDRAHMTDYYEPIAQMQEDHGTTHLSVIDAMGNAVGVTSTINLYFGSKVQGRRTGIFFNDEMDDFSRPSNETNYFGLGSSPQNFIEPRKRPMSSMTPAILWDARRQRVRMVIGAAGGAKITTGVALSIMDVLWLGRPLPSSLDGPRVHHQLLPPYYQAEPELPQEVIDGLEAKRQIWEPMRGWTVVNGIDVNEEGEIIASADYRKGGAPDGY